MNTREVILKAREKGKCVPAFNVPHIPMVKPIIEAIRDENSVAMIQVARVEWEKMKAESLERIAEEYDRYKDPAHTLLHLDHVPVIDEDYQRVDYRSLIERAIRAGYQSVMIDGSRLPLEENISATREAADLAHAAQIPCEAELGAVMGHENKVMPPYEEIFASKMGFTRLDEAKRFAEESKCDWLSVAVGNIHGAVAEAVRNQKKPEAKIDVAHVAELYRAVGIPLVLHGGSGIQHQYILDAISAGIAKINVGTELRQTYEFALQESGNDVSFAQDALYKRTRAYIAVIDMPEIVARATFDRKYTGIAKFPAVTRDISMVMPKEILVGQIEDVIESKGGEYLESYSLFDIYEGAQIKTGFKSVAYSIVFRAKDKTLEEAEITAAMDRILSGLEELGIELRK